ncbi:hypothetical protein LJB95_00935 [Paludibacteraceae bacterium OttesenSCG-928-F17]|nr:hypothetical protein [Paludibacteraceae bacterium OttesenSCG-928-F17]
MSTHSNFDRLAKQVFNRINRTFGESAVWLSGKRKRVNGTILFKDPTEPVQIGDTQTYEYRPNTVTVEFYAGTFDGLKTAVDRGTPQYMIVREQKYLIQEVTTKFDGKTLVAHLEPHED